MEPTYYVANCSRDASLLTRPAYQIIKNLDGYGSLGQVASQRSASAALKFMQSEE